MLWQMFTLSLDDFLRELAMLQARLARKRQNPPRQWMVQKRLSSHKLPSPVPLQQWAKLHSTNPIKRFNGGIKRRTEVVVVFSDADA